MKRLIRIGLVTLPLAWSGIALAQGKTTTTTTTDIDTDAAKQKGQDTVQQKSEGAVKDQAAPSDDTANQAQPKSDYKTPPPSSDTQALPSDTTKTPEQKSLDDKALDPKALDEGQKMQMQNPKDVAP